MSRPRIGGDIASIVYELWDDEQENFMGNHDVDVDVLREHLFVSLARVNHAFSFGQYVEPEAAKLLREMGEDVIGDMEGHGDTP
jgi:hypothetical protein